MPKLRIDFFPADWADDPLLKLCSMGARQLWLYLICFMHISKQRGYFTHTPEQVCKKANIDLLEYNKLLKELKKNGVFSVDDAGLMFSRRMVREEVRGDKQQQALRKAFDVLVDHYPNATLVSLARGEYDRLCADGTITVSNAHELLDGLNRWKASKSWRAEDGKYIPSLNKWLAEKRWLDKPLQDGLAAAPRRSRSGNDPMAVYDPNAND